MCSGKLPLAGEGIQELKEVFLSGDFQEGEGEIIETKHEDDWLDVGQWAEYQKTIETVK